MKRRALKIGITIGVSVPDESLWINGIKQNALYLARLFQHSPLRHDVCLLNTTDVAITDALPWSRLDFPTFPIAERIDDVDVLIELGGQIDPDQTERLKQRGAKIVSYCCGPEYAQNIEAMIFRRPLWDQIFINRRYDELWVIPQVAETTTHFLQTFRRAPARTVPFVWDPFILDAANAARPDSGAYRPRSGAKRLSVIEPNIDVLKFCLYPILIAEQAFRQRPDLIAFLHVANADRFVHDDREFAGLMRHLDIVAAQKASFIGRVQTPAFLADHTDVVVSHQWGLALNYVYLECCWLGYPLVHNAHLVADLGYYYPENDAAAGARRLIEALEHHDTDWPGYRRMQQRRIGRFLATNPALAAAYDDLLFGLFHG